MATTTPSLGLALGSGAARGFAHIGVLKVLDEEGIAISCLAGTSIGALIGVLYAAGVSPADLAKTSSELDWKKMARLMDPVWPTSGLIDGIRVRRFIEELLPVQTFDELRMPVGITATDVITGLPIIIRSGSLLDALQAAIAFPGIFNPVRFGDYYLIDGGLCNPVPSDVALTLGADKVIGVCAIPHMEKPRIAASVPLAAEHKPATSAFQLTARRIESLVRDLWSGVRPNGDNGRKPPSLFRVASQSIAIMENQINDLRLRLSPPDLLLRPTLHGLTLLEFHRAAEAIRSGEAEARNHLDELRALTRPRS